VRKVGGGSIGTEKGEKSGKEREASVDTEGNFELNQQGGLLCLIKVSQAGEGAGLDRGSLKALWGGGEKGFRTG